MSDVDRVTNESHSYAGFGAALRDVINRSGLKPSDWADELGVSRSAVSQWLKGRGGTRPRADRLHEIMLLAKRQRVPKSVMAKFEASIYDAKDEHDAAGTTGARVSFGETADRARIDHLAARILSLPHDRRSALLSSLEEDVRRSEGNDPLAPLTLSLNSSFGRVDREAGPVASQFLLDEITELAHEAERLARAGSYEKWARRRTDYILQLFTRLMNLPDDYCYDTCSNLDFWSKYTLESRRMFLAAQAAAARERGTEVRRVFLVPKGISFTDEEKLRLAEHVISETGIQAKVSPVSRSDIGGIGNFVLCGPLGGRDSVLFQINYRELEQSDVREFERVTMVTDEREIARRRSAFDDQFDRGIDIEIFLESLKLPAE